MATNHDFDPVQTFCPFCGQCDLLPMDDEGVCYLLCMECRTCGPTAESHEQALLAWCDRYNPDDNMRVYRRSARTIALDS
jgi:hypothetical protein